MELGNSGMNFGYNKKVALVAVAVKSDALTAAIITTTTKIKTTTKTTI